MSLLVEARVDHLATAARYAARPDDWPVAPRFHARRRWYHRLAVATDHEAWLLTWLPGQSTDLHDHGESAGAFIVLSGELTEAAVRLPTVGIAAPSLVARTMPAGAGRQFGVHHVHQVSNQGERPAISIHVYGPALATMTRYRLGPTGLETVGVDRAELQW